jgi:hypothetical protein
VVGGSGLSVYGPASVTLLNEAGVIVAENYNINEAGLRRKEADYRAEMIRVQGTLAYNVQVHKILETEYFKILEELDTPTAAQA